MLGKFFKPFPVDGKGSSQSITEQIQAKCLHRIRKAVYVMARRGVHAAHRSRQVRHSISLMISSSV